MNHVSKQNTTLIPTDYGTLQENAVSK